MPEQLSITLPTMSALSRRTLLRGVLLTGATAGLLAACAPSKGSSTNPSASASGAVGKDTGAEIDLLTVALPGSLSSLDVNTEAGILNYYVAAIAQEGLLEVAPDGTLAPGLAESWEIVNPTTYTFTLRSDATFADGTPVTIDDVLFSIEKARDPEVSPGTSWAWGGVDTATQTGDNQITITLLSPNVGFGWIPTAAGALFVTSKAFFEAAGTVGTSSALILGSGPYRATSFQADSHAEFERVDTWWGGVPKVKKVRFEFIADENARLLARQSGDIDVALNVPLDQSDQWQKVDDTRVLFTPDHSWVGITFDTTVAPFDDVNVRKAVAHAADRASIVSGILKGHGSVALGFPTPDILATTVDADAADKLLASLPQLNFDLAAAKKALAASSVPDGFTAEWTYPNTGKQLGQAALAIAEQLKTIGVTINVKEVPIEEWLATIGDGAHGIGYMWYFSTTGDPAELITYLLGDGNPAAYSSSEVTDLLAKSAAETDPKARADLLIKLNMISNTELPYWPLWWGEAATGVANEIGLTDYSAFFLLSPWPENVYAAA